MSFKTTSIIESHARTQRPTPLHLSKDEPNSELSSAPSPAPVVMPPSMKQQAASIPTVAPPSSPLLSLSDGQLLLLRAGVGDTTRVGIVEEGRVMHLIGGGNSELSFDYCSQAVLPWRPPRAGWDTALREDVKALHSLWEQMLRLNEEIQALTLAEVAEAVCMYVYPRKTAVPPSSHHQTKDLGYSYAQVTEAVMQALAAEVTGAVNAATLPPSLAAPLLAAAEDVRIALKVRSSEARLENLKTSVANLHPEVIATRVMVDSGALGRRRYAPSQPLTVRHAGKWSDVHASDAPCELQPWNHAPRELSEADFDVLAFWHAQALRNQHATIFDPFLGRTLDTLEECMRIEVTGRDPEGHHISISDASSLSDWLHGLHMSAVAWRRLYTDTGQR